MLQVAREERSKNGARMASGRINRERTIMPNWPSMSKQPRVTFQDIVIQEIDNNALSLLDNAVKVKDTFSIASGLI